jgi:hypothetical protein
MAERVAYDLNTRDVDPRRYFLWYERERVGKRVIASQSLQQNKHENVYSDESVIYDRLNSPIRIVVAYRKHVSPPLLADAPDRSP